jgi:hypothetical protein
MACLQPIISAIASEQTKISPIAEAKRRKNTFFAWISNGQVVGYRLSVEVEFADEKSARVFEKFIGENIRSNKAMKPTITAASFGETFLTARFRRPQFSHCPCDVAYLLPGK